MMYGIYNNGFGYNGMMNFFGGGIMMIVYLILFIILIVWLVREISGRNSHNTHSNALDVLKERYAKGEINKEEFESKKKDLIK